MKNIIALALLVISFTSYAGIETHQFDNDGQEKLYIKLTEELRCLVCQNQNIAGSNAELATDLREKTYTLIKAGKNESEIKTWMIERYGDFVLYKPPFKMETLLLWLGPVFLFIIAIIVVVRLSSKNTKSKDAINESQHQKIHDLMKSEENQ